ncbi:acetyl-CoA C-acyltransferase [Kyrpidia spormannii]|uniref:3-ketoacyl-CoA thiolase n=2 Tax=Kyrpidia spormannii TaxID=2055160 RepID=A0A2K8N4B0_9BACL|nr:MULTISPECIES: thiolase family protein [Kyrpidia]ATY84236.1 acetyl-CoA C-acyltransferase [Kyrpidia spormannii]MCL6576096.1 thiolase family protein [Kyrpidia sp.]CAB3390638.1 3-ketoacyl-CoA thiolase [Kyrpidia spormannii]CAB3391551.1 3-ketoacyl-CoA thiolase [Kyrpidia spormannii]
MREAVIVDAIRTPIGRRKGSLAQVHPVDLLGGVLKQLVSRNGLDAAAVDDVIVGCVDQVGEQSVNIGRNAWLSAGLPESVPAVTIDRQCGSSLQALHFAAQGVMAGVYDIAIAAGVESMTRVPMMSTIGVHGVPMTRDLQERYRMDRWNRQFFDQALGAEMIAKQWGFTREDLDRFGLRSHELATKARQKGCFAREIVPVQVPVPDAPGEYRTFAEDEGIRPDTSLEKMLALPPAFEDLELITAGNASQISDGASAALVMSREMAERLGLRPRARFVAFAAVGVDPVTMLTGPIPATQKVLDRAGLKVEDIDLFEVNEAFASVVLAWQKEIGAPWDKVNVHGGAVAIGHPLGATGTRITATLLNGLEERKGRYGLMAICEGGGMANATIIERIPE